VAGDSGLQDGMGSENGIHDRVGIPIPRVVVGGGVVLPIRQVVAAPHLLNPQTR